MHVVSEILSLHFNYIQGVYADAQISSLLFDDVNCMLICFISLIGGFMLPHIEGDPLISSDNILSKDRLYLTKPAEIMEEWVLGNTNQIFPRNGREDES